MKFELWTTKAGLTFWHLRAANGEIVLASEGYRHRVGALATIYNIRANALKAIVRLKSAGAPKNSPRGLSFEIWETRAKQTAYHLQAANGEIIAAAETYKNRQDALDTIHAIQAQVLDATLVELQPARKDKR